MARSSATEPLEKFRFRVSFSVGGISEGDENTVISSGWHDVQMPKRSTNKGTYREGDDNDINQLFPGLSTMEDIVLSRGVLPRAAGADGIASKLYSWMAAVHKPSSGNSDRVLFSDQVDAAHKYRKDVTIEMFDREGAVARAWKLYQAWPVNFVPGSDLNAGEDGEKSMEQLTLCYEDFQEMEVTAQAASTDEVGDGNTTPDGGGNA